MSKQRIWQVWVIAGLVLGLLGCQSAPRPLRAGLRASGYGIEPFPTAPWWIAATGDMAGAFDEQTAPAVIWIVGTMADDTHCHLNLPRPAQGEVPGVVFSGFDFDAPYLDEFDKNGVKVWLQVEPADADMLTLIDLVLKQHSHHPSVVGFGVDVEWRYYAQNREGVAVTDAEARAWVERIRSYNPDYQLFLKHWLPEKMPPTYRDGVVFVDDSQGFESYDALVEEFQAWGEAFAPAGVAFQYGYESDEAWWGQLDNPPITIGKRLVETVPNLADLYWVDFSAYKIWPPTTE